MSEEKSSNLVVLAFDGLETAGEVLRELESLEKAGELVLEDAVIAQRREGPVVDVTQAKVEPAVTEKATTRGGAIGLVAGLLIGGPIIGLMGGLAIGHLLGKMKDSGMDNSFIDSVSEALAPNSSALFLLVREANAEKAVSLLKSYQGRVLRTSLDPEREEALRKALGS